MKIAYEKNLILEAETLPFDFDQDVVDPEELILKMAKTMREANGIGLAGPQVGVQLKVFVIDIPWIIACFNPKIIEYSKEEIIQNKSNVLALRFVDRLNDYGIVVVIIFDFVGKKLKIINWVMSCRVFSRNIEYAVYRILKRIAIKSSCNKIL